VMAAVLTDTKGGPPDPPSPASGPLQFGGAGDEPSGEPLAFTVE
jgi:hypothetical protein